MENKKQPKQQERKASPALELQPEGNKNRPLAYFQVDRYTQGPFRGLFLGFQLVEDKDGKPKAKMIAEGVDMVVLMSAIETALRKRVYG